MTTLGKSPRKTVTTLDWSRDHVREREGGLAIDVYGETRFVKADEVVTYHVDETRVYVGVSRQAAARLMARPR